MAAKAFASDLRKEAKVPCFSGYSWKKGRFVPEKRPDEELVKQHKAALETLKRGQAKDV